MQHVLRYGLFSATKPLEKALRGASSNAGYFISGLSNAKPSVVKRSSFYIESFIGFGIDGTEDVFLSSVDSNNASFGFGFWDIDFDGQVQVPYLVDEFKFGVGPTTFGQSSGLIDDEFFPNGQTLAADVEVTFPANRYDEFGVFGEAPFLVGSHGAIGRGDVAEEGAGDLGRQLKFFSDGGVEFFGETVRAWWMIPSTEDDLREPVASVPVSNRNVVELVCSGGDFQFVCSQALHTILLYRRLYDSFKKSGKGLRKEDAGNSSQRLKTVGFPCQNCG
jgi:hypothetical protein